jgi:branched-chain amino acid transport system permease protein
MVAFCRWYCGSGIRIRTAGLPAFDSTLRLREDYLAIATIGIAEVLRRMVVEEGSVVNGTNGLVGIPRPFGGWFDPSDYKYAMLVIAVVVLVLVFIAVERGIRSPRGGC